MKKTLHFLFVLLACFAYLVSPLAAAAPDEAADAKAKADHFRTTLALPSPAAPIGTLSIPIKADEGNACGPSMTWTYNNGTLTITGSGAMYDYDPMNNLYAPWWNYRANISTIVFSGSIISIGDYAFLDFDNITSVSFPDSVVVIGEGAFTCCAKLNTVNLPKNLVLIGPLAFATCEKIAAITFPNSLESIYYDAFDYCTSLKTVSFNNGLQEIYADAFLQCPALKCVTVPSTVTHIGETAFGYDEEYNPYSNFYMYGFDNTAAQTYADGNDFLFICISKETPYFYLAFDNRAVLVHYFGDDTKITVPSQIDRYTVTGLGASLFEENTAITSVTIPNTVTDIGESCFSQCTALKTVTIPDSVTKIEALAFSSCIALQSLTIPKNLTEINFGTFAICSSLTTVTIPPNIQTVGGKAFAACKKLTTVTLSDGIKTINEQAFSLCDALASVKIPNSVTKIGANAFGYTGNNFDNLHKITGFTIYGNQGTAAETYANNNGFTFIPLTYAITVTQGNGGTINPGTTTVNYGASQTFAITAIGGYEIQNVTVDGVAKGAVTSYTFTDVTAAHTISATFTQKIAVAFNDVPGGIWYEPYVNDLVSKGILTGYGNSDGSISFKPDRTISRAEFATILARTSGDDLTPYVNKSSFNDVATSYWGAKYIEWAYQKGVVSGKGSGTYDPNANITRQEMAVMIHNYVTKCKKQTLPQTVPAMTFSDQSQIASWASTAVTAMQQAGIINGTANSDGSARFEPSSNATRAQAAKMISVYLGL